MRDYTGITHGADGSRPPRGTGGNGFGYTPAHVRPLIPDERLPILLEAAETLGSRHIACVELRMALDYDDVRSNGAAWQAIRRLSTVEQRAILERYAETVSAP